MLELQHTLYYYDGPLLAIFAMEGKSYIGVKVHVDGADEPIRTNNYKHYEGFEYPFLLTPISLQTFFMVVANELTLHNAFLHGGEWLAVDYSDDYPPPRKLTLDQSINDFPGKVMLRR